MVPRWLGLVATCLAACGGSADPIVGTWTFGTKTVELRGDGSIVAPPRSDPACAPEKAAVAACAREHRWAKQGGGYRLTMMTLVPPAGVGGLGSLFSDRPADTACRCVPDIVGTAELQGDELVIDGKERARRVKP